MRRSYRTRALVAVLAIGLSAPLPGAALAAGKPPPAAGKAPAAAGKPPPAAGKAPAAAGKRAPAAAPAPAIDVAALVGELQGRDPAAVLAALAAARDAGAAAALVAPAVEQLLAQGATVEIAKAAVEALAAIGLPSSSAAIRPYLAHRAPELRRQAVKALAKTRGPEAVAALRDGLRSSDAVVRGYAATGLGALDATGAVADLFLALDRRVDEAASAIGQLCDPAACAAFTARLGALPFDVVVSGFDPILFRRTPLPDEVLLEIVRRVRALATPEAGRFLADAQSRWPPNGSKAVKQALDAAASAIPAGRP